MIWELSKYMEGSMKGQEVAGSGAGHAQKTL